MLVRADLNVDVSAALGEQQELAVRVVAPGDGLPVEPRSAVVLLPGGSYNRNYWDAPEDVFPGYSFAGALARRGHVAIVIDHPGMGASSVPADGDALTAAGIGSCHAEAVAQIRTRLHDGSLVPDLRPAPDVAVVGAGHSNGACVLLHQQGMHRSYDAVGVFGYSNQFMVLPYEDDEKPGMTEEMHRARAEQMLRGVITSEWGPYLDFDMAALHGLFHADDVPDAVTQAHDVFYSRTPRGSSVDASIPGRAAGHAATISTPVFLSYGAHDVCLDPHLEPSTYPRSPDITLHVLPGAAHCTALASRRAELSARFGGWLDGVAQAGGVLAAERQAFA